MKVHSATLVAKSTGNPCIKGRFQKPSEWLGTVMIVTSSTQPQRSPVQSSQLLYSDSISTAMDVSGTACVIGGTSATFGSPAVFGMS